MGYLAQKVSIKMNSIPVPMNEGSRTDRTGKSVEDGITCWFNSRISEVMQTHKMPVPKKSSSRSLGNR